MLSSRTLFERRDEEGQGLAEYALILALIAIVAIVALIFLGGQVSRSCPRSAARSSCVARERHEAAGTAGGLALPRTMVLLRGAPDGLGFSHKPANC